MTVFFDRVCTINKILKHIKLLLRIFSIVEKCSENKKNHNSNHVQLVNLVLIEIPDEPCLIYAIFG